MSERTRNSPAGTPVAFSVGVSTGRSDLLRGVDPHLYGGTPARGAGVGSAPWGNSSRHPRLGGRVYLGGGSTGGSPHWYRRLALTASGASGVALLVIYLAQRGVIG